MSRLDLILPSCPLARWSGERGRCHWCDVELTGRRTSWCSDECGTQAWSNHAWNWARHAAMRRDDQRCVRCPPDAKVGLLQVHHRDDKADGRHGQISCCHHIDGLETLCLAHHTAAHRQMAALARHQLSLDLAPSDPEG